MKFNKRIYENWREPFEDVHFLIRNREQVRQVEKGKSISPAFKERLMIAVTAVNGCRYCSWFHSREAFKSGVNKEEIARLLSGSVDSCSEEEATAILYAQHWA